MKYYSIVAEQYYVINGTHILTIMLGFSNNILFKISKMFWQVSVFVVSYNTLSVYSQHL